MAVLSGTKYLFLCDPAEVVSAVWMNICDCGRKVVKVQALVFNIVFERRLYYAIGL